MSKPYGLETPGRRQKLIGLLAEGLTYEAAAQSMATPTFKVTKPSVWEFAQRHSVEIAERKTDLANLTRDEWLADKGQRIRKLAGIYQVVAEAMDEHGVMVTETRTTGAGQETVETQRFNGAMVRELRGILRDAAEELGQIPRSTDTNVTNLQVLIRQYNGDNSESV